MGFRRSATAATAISLALVLGGQVGVQAAAVPMHLSRQVPHDQWTRQQLLHDPPGPMSDVGCTSPTLCVGVATSGGTVVFDGSTWSAPVPLGIFAAAVSCSTSLCGAVGGRDVVLFDGVTWSAPVEVDLSSYLTAISFSSAAFCMAGDGAGAMYEYRHGVWTPSTGIFGAPVQAVSCASSRFCVAVDQNGDASLFDGGQWTHAGDVDTQHYPTGLLCPSIRFCVVVDYTGYAVTYDGSTWGAVQQIDPQVGLEDVACGSSSM